MSVDIDGPLAAEWMRGRTVLVTGGGGRDDGGPGTIGWAICALDTLVNNVPAWSAAELFDVEPDRFDEMMVLNLKAAWQMTRHATRVMKSNPPTPPTPAIVNISSVAARRAGTLYGLGKAATEAMTEGSAYLMGERGIRVNAVQLGALWSGAVAANLPAEAREPRRRMVALQTEGTCWDAASAVLFLASEQARWISGQVLSVDGGGPGRAPYPGVTRPAAAGGSSATPGEGGS